MIISVFSDLHGGSKTEMELAFETSDYVIYLGDGLAYVRDFEYEYPMKFIFVRGNCDAWDDTPLERTIYFDDVKVLATHGHAQNVKLGLGSLLKKAKEEGVNIVLYGHTHKAVIEEIDGILFVNPGSANRFNASNGSYARLNITNSHYFAEIINFD